MKTRNDNGIPLALGAAGLLAVAGLLRKRGSLASDPETRAQHLRRLLEPGSGVSEAEQDLARRSLEAMQTQTAGPPGRPDKSSGPSGLTEMKRGRLVESYRRGTNHPVYNIVEDGVPDGGGYLVHPEFADQEFYGVVAEDAPRSGVELVEQRERVVALTGRTARYKGDLLTDVEWVRHPGLDSLSDKIFLLNTLSDYSKARDKGGRDYLKPGDLGGPFNIGAGIVVRSNLDLWTAALNVLMQMHPLSSSGQGAEDLRREDSASNIGRPRLGNTLKILPTGESDPVWSLMKDTSSNASDNRQTWAVVFLDTEDSQYNRMYHLGSSPLVWLKLAEAIELVKAEMPDRHFFVEVIQSYTVKRATRPTGRTKNSDGARRTKPLVVRKLLPAPVQIYRNNIERVKDLTARVDLSFTGAPKAGLWNEVLRLIDEEGDHEEWFRKALERHK